MGSSGSLEAADADSEDCGDGRDAAPVDDPGVNGGRALGVELGVECGWDTVVSESPELPESLAMTSAATPVPPTTVVIDAATAILAPRDRVAVVAVLAVLSVPTVLT
ncbi:hypothetical protein, partial [Timonella senegalensis]|uniref:hypothetical protein n=1 Tax=Timonella senegalensis TaxID=1465825 RepID=UPI002FE182F1